MNQLRRLPTMYFMGALMFLFSTTALGYATDDDKSRCDQTVSKSPLRDSICNVISDSEAKATELHAFLVEKGGVVIAERYFSGRDKEVGQFFTRDVNFGPTTLHDTRSISKSVVSLLIGIAIEKQKIPSLDTPLAVLLPEQQAFFADDELKRKITVRHLLTMSSGIAWDEDGAVSLLSNETRMEFSSNMLGYVLRQPMATKPGERYVYNSGGVIILGAILERVSGIKLNQLAMQWLFAPLGIQSAPWHEGRQGQVMAHTGLRLIPRDLAKLGRLLLNRGNHAGQQIVPANYLHESTQAYLPAELDWRYGFLWRIGKVNALDRSYDWVAAFGNGGQRLFIIPALDIVVVITAGRYNVGGYENSRASHELLGRIVEAVTH
jgi:CubicO group peptidase (beta-lactamase class C family)